MEDVRAIPYLAVNQPKLQTKQLTNWAGKDLWMLGFSLLSTIAVFVVSVKTGTTLLWGFVWALFIAPFNARLPKSFGRLYSEIAESFRSTKIIGLEGLIWAADDASGAFTRWLRYSGQARRGYGAIPFGLVQVKAVVQDRVSRYGLLRQLDRPYDHLFLTARGGAFSRLDITSQTMANDELSRVVNQVLAQSDLKAGMGFVRITGPFDQTELSGYLAEHGNPAVIHNELFSLDEDTRAWAELLAENLSQLRPVAASWGGAKMLPMIVITIRRSRSWRKALRGKATDEQLLDTPIIELGRELEEALANANLLELDDIHCLGLAELAMVVRCSWDVVGIQEWYRKRAAGEIPATDDAIDEILQAALNKGYSPQDAAAMVTEALQVWPSKRVAVPVAHTDMLELDGNFSSVLRVTRLPDKVRSDAFLSLHYRMRRGQWTRMAMVGQGVSAKTETNRLVASQSVAQNLQTAFFSNRVVEHPKFGRRKRALEAQANAIDSTSVSQHFNMLFPVLTDSESTCLQARKQVKAMLVGQGFEVEIVPLASRQVNAFFSGALAANRL